MNLLLVDDNRLRTIYLATYLRGKGHQVDFFTDPRNVEAWLETNPCDGIILDVAMPGMNGFALLENIRKMFDRTQLVAVYYTDLGYNTESLLAAVAAGANGYVAKTASPVELYAKFVEAYEHRNEVLQEA